MLNMSHAKPLALSFGLLFCTLGLAQEIDQTQEDVQVQEFGQAREVGRVISATPVVQQVAVAREVCSVEPVAVQRPRSGAGAVLGAIAGGAMGNAIGDGSGRAAATIIGLIGGAMIGDRVEHSGQYAHQPVQQCTTHHIYEPRTTGYNVVYEYAGKQYSVLLPYDPGPTIQLQITPVGVGTSSLEPSVALPARVVRTAPMYGPVYPAHVVRPYPYYHPPISLHFGFGYSGGYRHHRRWR
jgi:uncharacterized protein YcfJ